MKKVLGFILAAMTIASSSIVFANDDITSSVNPCSSFNNSVEPRIHRRNLKVSVKQNQLCKITSDLNIFKEDVTVLFESSSQEVSEIYLTLKKRGDDEGIQSETTLSVGESYTFGNVSAGGYTVYATSCDGDGTCYFTVSNDI